MLSALIEAECEKINPPENPDEICEHAAIESGNIFLCEAVSSGKGTCPEALHYSENLYFCERELRRIKNKLTDSNL